MAHPDHDQVIGRLVGARLRGAADRRAVSGGAAEAHPDAEAWAAYVDGGLRADEVVRLETHLAGCPACRRLLAVLAADVSADAAPAVREVEVPAAERGVVIPFPRRQVFVWMAAAAGLLMAVTLWSVSRLGDHPASRVAMSAPPAEAPAPLAVPPAPSPADAASRTSAAQSRLEDAKALDQVAGQAPAGMERGVARQEQDKRKPDSRSDALAIRQPAEFAAAEEKQAVQAGAAPAGNARDIQLQTNVPSVAMRPRGPLANQQANQQAGNQQQYAQPVPAPQAPPLPATSAPMVAAPSPAGAAAKSTPPPTPAPAAAPTAEPVAPPALADAAAADTRERRANELNETVTITASGAGARRTQARAQPERSQAAGAEREGQSKSKDEAPTFKAVGSLAGAAALPSFTEPGGRLRWRIADGRRLESSSDGGNTWTGQFTARARLRTGTAPAIDSAWAVGEAGLVLRFVVPGGWAEVSRPAPATLVAVSATSGLAARVTADDGRAFETTDGGVTWMPAAPGAGPQ